MNRADLWLRLRALLLRRRVEQELQEEIESHIEMQTRKNASRGMRHEDARQEARTRFGGVYRIAEECRQIRGLQVVDGLYQDLRYALRTFRRNPAFSLVAVLTLAMGIGMNTAVFSVVNAVLLRPLSYPDPGRLVWLSTRGGGLPFNAEAVSASDFAAWRDETRSFDGMAAYDSMSDQTLATADSAVQVRIAWVTADFWKISGARPAFGRFPNDGERDLLVLARSLFERQFQGDPRVVGKVVTLNGRQVTIAGVLPEDFLFQLPYGFAGPGFEPKEVEGYRPLIVQPQPRARGQLLQVLAKLKPEVSIDQARNELQATHSRIAEADSLPAAAQSQVRIAPLQDRLVGGGRLMLWILLGAVVFVLLIACANIGNLLLARAATRHKEIAIRASVGAGRLRVLRHHCGGQHHHRS